MENRAHAIIAVCFLVVFAVAAALIFYWLSSGPSEPLTYRIVTNNSVSGLAPQAKVVFKGIQVGHVTRIRFDPDNRSRVIIDFNVRRHTYITHATYAVIAMQGLTGGKSLELKIGKGSSASLKTSSEHPAHIPLRQGLMAQLEASARQDMKDIQDILASTRKLLDTDNREHIAASLKQMDAATAKLVAIETQLLPVVRQMPALMKSTRKSLAKSHALLANANKLVRDAQGPVGKLGKVEDTFQQMGHTLNKQTAPDIGQLTRSLTRTSRLLQQLIRELKAKPQSVIFGPPEPPPGPGEPGFKANNKKGSGHE